MEREQLATVVSEKAEVARMNTANEARRLEEKIKSHNSAARNSSSSLSSNDSLNRFNNNNNTARDRLTRKIGSSALKSAGVPSALSNKLMDLAKSKEGKNALKNLARSRFGPLGGAVANKLLNNKMQDEADDKPKTTDGFVSFSVSVKFIKYALIVSIPVFTVLIFCCLFITAIQVYYDSISLGMADSLTGEEAEKIINEKLEDLNDDVTYVSYINDSKSEILRNSKLLTITDLQTKSKYITRKYNEATLEKIEDFYPAVVDESKNYDEEMAYDFYYKMYNLYLTYRDEETYNVVLDLPLLMATLNLQSTDKNVIFEANLSSVDRRGTPRKLPIAEFDYYYDWFNTNYKINRDESEHDMELLVQAMISKQVREVCVDSKGKEVNEKILRDNEIGTQTLFCNEGEIYKIEELGFQVDHEKYKEFLREFLEKKYYLDGDNKLSKRDQSTEYEFEDPENESLVNELIVDIYNIKEQYEDLAGGYEDDEVEIQDAVNASYWWPIGSEKTVEVSGKIFAKDEPFPTVVTSPYGYRIHPLKGTRHLHSGVDIAGGVGNGIVNIIAAQSGVVVYPTANVSNDCPSSTSLSDCGSGYGNYVIIQHTDGNYTVYAHLDAHSITVVAGDSVAQGQVIAKMGSSGNSTGTHLHFEVREGQNAYNATVDPLMYISLENTRQVSAGEDFINWLKSWEGYTEVSGDYYIVEDIGDGVRTVGSGITLENNPNKFLEYGINIDDYPVGSKIPIVIVDKMTIEVVNQKRSNIERILAENSITLKENEIQALISQMYNTGNIKGFPDNYKIYGNTQELYDKWFFRNIMKGTIFEAGLTRRRNAEWSLFHLGEYVFN